MKTNLEQYLSHLLPPDQEWINDLEQRAEDEHIPIMERTAIHFLCHLISIIKPRRILEIGTGIGYSALRMLDAYRETSIMTIERDKERYRQAKKIIKDHLGHEQINVIHGDARHILTDWRAEKFDLIFIDAAKGQYQRFFELSHPLLADHGIIVSDNVLFRGYVMAPHKAPKRLQSLVKKLVVYNEWLMNHPNYVTSIIPIGDGVALSYKK